MTAGQRPDSGACGRLFPASRPAPDPARETAQAALPRPGREARILTSRSRSAVRNPSSKPRTRPAAVPERHQLQPRGLTHDALLPAITHDINLVEIAAGAAFLDPQVPRASLGAVNENRP